MTLYPVLVKLSDRDNEQFLLLQETSIDMVREYLHQHVTFHSRTWDGEEFSDADFEVIDLDLAQAAFLEDTFGIAYGVGPLVEMFEKFFDGSWLH